MANLNKSDHAYSIMDWVNRSRKSPRAYNEASALAVAPPTPSYYSYTVYDGSITPPPSPVVEPKIEEKKQNDLLEGDELTKAVHTKAFWGITTEEKLLPNEHGFFFFEGSKYEKHYPHYVDLDSLMKIHLDLTMYRDNYEGCYTLEKYRKNYSTLTKVYNCNVQLIGVALMEQTADCGAYALKNSNAASTEIYGNYLTPLLKLYCLLYQLEHLVCTRSFVIFSQTDYRKGMEPYKSLDKELIPRISEILQKAAEYSGMWHGLNHPRYEMKEIVEGQTKSVRMHSVGMINYAGYKKMVSKYLIPTYGKYLPDIRKET